MASRDDRPTILIPRTPALYSVLFEVRIALDETLQTSFFIFLLAASRPERWQPDSAPEYLIYRCFSLQPSHPDGLLVCPSDLRSAFSAILFLTWYVP